MARSRPTAGRRPKKRVGVTEDAVRTARQSLITARPEVQARAKRRYRRLTVLVDI